ncbi:hypothetical protein [Massilia sp. CCM 8734]|uniref:hypothetical protein n=1 Tax=Massilia sp. CCM 8734 TaxID=2609283 RepID=UPI00141DC7EE|nr:hypothetical protein [Massilia sp. CCM 8734]NIA00889.1 hypothetical protein [Massilia sp. CCM 8734]
MLEIDLSDVIGSDLMNCGIQNIATPFLAADPGDAPDRWSGPLAHADGQRRPAGALPALRCRAQRPRNFVLIPSSFTGIISKTFQRVAMNKMTPGEIFRSDFADRLRCISAFAPYSSSPTALSKAFNVRFPRMTITSHAARKWLIGEAIPTQEKLVALAEWFNVDPTWLRFGDSSGSSQSLPLQKNSDRIEFDLRLLTEPIAKRFF